MGFQAVVIPLAGQTKALYGICSFTKNISPVGRFCLSPYPKFREILKLPFSNCEPLAGEG